MASTGKMPALVKMLLGPVRIPSAYHIRGMDSQGLPVTKTRLGTMPDNMR